MRPRTLRRRLVLAGLGAVLAGATLGTGVAKADTVHDYDRQFGGVFCTALDRNPTNAQLDAIAVRMLSDGLTTRQAADTLALTISTRCPWQTATVNAWAATVSPRYVA